MKLVIVPAHAGWRWVKLGISTFFKQPLALAGLLFMFLAFTMLLAQLPILGTALSTTLLPGLTLGLMAASAEAERRRFPKPLVLLSAFRKNRRQSVAMLRLGALYTLGVLLALGGSYLMDGGGFARIYLGHGLPDSAALEAPALVSALAVFIGLHIPVSLTFWHAPALLHWHGLPVSKSLFFSLVACWRNLAAFAVFGLAWLSLLVLALLAVSVLSSLSALVSHLLTPLLLMLLAMFFTSLFFSYRDCFENATPPDSSAATQPAGF